MGTFQNARVPKSQRVIPHEPQPTRVFRVTPYYISHLHLSTPPPHTPDTIPPSYKCPRQEKKGREKGKKNSELECTKEKREYLVYSSATPTALPYFTPHYNRSIYQTITINIYKKKRPTPPIQSYIPPPSSQVYKLNLLPTSPYFACHVK